MTTLDRYLAWEFTRNLLFLAVCFISLFLIVDFFEKIRMFLSNDATAQQISAHFLYRIPMLLTQTLPAAVLLASLVTCGYLARHNEFVAIKANGISLYRASRPILIIAGLACLVAFLLGEAVTPYTNERAEHIRLIDVQKHQSMGSFKQDQIWYRGQKGIYNIKLFDVRNNTLKGITLYYLDRDMNLLSRLDAQSAEWKGGHWLFHDVLVTNFQTGEFPTLSKVAEQQVDIPETPDDFKVVQKDVETLGYFELRRFIQKLQIEGYDATRYIVDLDAKIAFSFVSVILAVIGISFSLRSERSGGIAQGVGAGLMIGFSYWLVHAFGLSLGRSGTLPPLIAAWFGNILFGGVSIWLYLRLKT